MLRGGGACFFISKKLKEKSFSKIRSHLKDFKIPLHLGEPELRCEKVYAPAGYGEVTFKLILEEFKKCYDDPAPSTNWWSW